MASTGNAYCDRLDIEVPCLEKILHATNPKLFPLRIVALLEQGGQMSLDRFVNRFLEAGLDAHSDDLRHPPRVARKVVGRGVRCARPAR